MADNTGSSFGSPFANLKIEKPDKLLDITNPANRTKEGYRNVIENFFYWGFVMSNGEYISYLKIEEWVTNRLISQGKYYDNGWLENKLFGKWDNSKGPRETQPERELMSMINLDWERLKFWPQLRDQIISRIEEMDFDNVCTAINPEAGDLKEDIKWQLWAQKESREWLAEMQQATQADMGGQMETPIPINNRQDLEMWMKTGYKHNFETAMQVAVKSALNGGTLPKKQLKKMLIEDIVDLGIFGVDTVTNPFDGTTTVEYIDPVNMVIPEWRGHILDHPKKIAIFKTYTAQELMTLIDEPLTADQKSRLLAFNRYQFGNAAIAGNINVMTNTDSENSIWQTFNCAVMKMYFLNSDRLKFSEKNSGAGKKFVPADIDSPLGDREYIDSGSDPGNPKKAIEKISALDLEYYEQVSWVIGTDIVFQYGKVPNQARDLLKASRAVCPCIMYRVNTASYTDRIRAIDEALNLAWLKIQQAKATAVPDGYTIDVSMLDGITVGGKISKKMAIRLFTNTGICVFNGKDNIAPGERGKVNPIERRDGGLGNNFIQLLEDFQRNLDMMEKVVGFNDLTTGATPAERTGAEVSQIAVASTTKSLKQTIDGLGCVFDRASEIVAQKIQWEIRNGDKKIIENSLGRTITHIMGMDTVDHRFAFQWQALPTEQMKQDLLNMVSKTLVNPTDPMQGGTHLDDYFYLYDLINSECDFKLVQLIAASIVKKNIAAQTAQATASQKMASDSAAQQEQLKHKNALEMQQLKDKNKLDQINAEGEWALKGVTQKDANNAHHTIIKGNLDQQHTILEHQLNPTPK